MFRLAIEMLVGDRVKFIGLLLGVSFTAFLVTFAMGYFSGFMTDGFALITENPAADVWVMDPAVTSVEATIGMPDAAVAWVGAVPGVARARPLRVADAQARMPGGEFQAFQVIAVDDQALLGLPPGGPRHLRDDLRRAGTVLITSGGTSGKLQVPEHVADQWPWDGIHPGVQTRRIRADDRLRVDGHRLDVVGWVGGLSRFPARPLMYTTMSNARAFLPDEGHSVSFVLVQAAPGVASSELARRITAETGLRARSAADFKADTVRWYLINSEDVGDMVSMLMLALVVGLGVTGVMLYMFSYENLGQYAVLKAMGASRRQLVGMVLTQAGTVAVLGVGIGLGVCSLVGYVVAAHGDPFRMLWIAPATSALAVSLIALLAGWVSMRPVLRLSPGEVFAGR